MAVAAPSLIVCCFVVGFSFVWGWGQRWDWGAVDAKVSWGAESQEPAGEEILQPVPTWPGSPRCNQEHQIMPTSCFTNYTKNTAVIHVCIYVYACNT